MSLSIVRELKTERNVAEDEVFEEDDTGVCDLGCSHGFADCLSRDPEEGSGKR